MSNVKKPNQHLENLIKADGFNDLPYWYKEFLHKLMMIGQTKEQGLVYMRQDRLCGFLEGVFTVNVITRNEMYNLEALVEEAVNDRNRQLRGLKGAA